MNKVDLIVLKYITVNNISTTFMTMHLITKYCYYNNYENINLSFKSKIEKKICGIYCIH